MSLMVSPLDEIHSLLIIWMAFRIVETPPRDLKFTCIKKTRLVHPEPRCYAASPWVTLLTPGQKIYPRLTLELAPRVSRLDMLARSAAPLVDVPGAPQRVQIQYDHWHHPELVHGSITSSASEAFGRVEELSCYRIPTSVSGVLTVYLPKAHARRTSG